MPYSPPRWLESLGKALVPPASAEHVLGDLAECSRGGAEYRRNLVSILPRVIWSQIRRRAKIAGVIFHAILTAGALLAFQGIFKSPLLSEPWGPLRLSAIWGIWVFGCALAAAYGPREKPTSWSRPVFLGTIAAALGAAVVLGVPFAPVAAALGATYGMVLLLSMPWLARTVPPPLSVDTLPAHAHQFQRVIWWRNARESLACVVVIAFNVRDLWPAEGTLDALGHLLIVAGVAFVMGFLHFRAQSRRVPADADVKAVWRFHRREIARQRDILRSIVWWYLMPFVPGFIVTMASKWRGGGPSTVIGLLIVMAVFVAVWRLNLWGARRLDGELQKVDALEGQL